MVERKRSYHQLLFYVFFQPHGSRLVFTTIFKLIRTRTHAKKYIIRITYANMRSNKCRYIFCRYRYNSAFWPDSKLGSTPYDFVILPKSIRKCHFKRNFKVRFCEPALLCFAEIVKTGSIKMEAATFASLSSSRNITCV